MRKAALARRIPRSSPQSRRTRPIRASRSKLLFRRVGLDRGDELIRVLGERETFSRVSVEWPLAGAARRRLIALSAAPMFGRHREFLGYRGFGVLGEEIETVVASESHVPAELVEDHRSALAEAVGAEALVADE